MDKQSDLRYKISYLVDIESVDKVLDQIFGYRTTTFVLRFKITGRGFHNRKVITYFPFKSHFSK